MPPGINYARAVHEQAWGPAGDSVPTPFDREDAYR